jgi:hypothetical protein
MSAEVALAKATVLLGCHGLVRALSTLDCGPKCSNTGPHGPSPDFIPLLADKPVDKPVDKPAEKPAVFGQIAAADASCIIGHVEPRQDGAMRVWC